MSTDHPTTRARSLAPTLLLAAFVAFLPSPASGDGPALSPEDFVGRWAETINENSAEKQLAFYDRSDAAEMIVSSGHHHRGFAEIEKVHRETFEMAQFSGSEVRDLHARVLGETAIVTFEHRFKILVLGDRSEWQFRVRTSSVLHREGSGWKIVAEHSSPIHGVDRMVRVGR